MLFFYFFHVKFPTAAFYCGVACDLKRFFFAGAAELVPDKQGRVQLTPVLREYAHLDKDVMVIGTGSRVEIWDLSRWNRYNAEISERQVLEVMNLYDI